MSCKGTCVKLNQFGPDGSRMMRDELGRIHPQCPPCLNCALPMPELAELLEFKLAELRQELRKQGIRV